MVISDYFSSHKNLSISALVALLILVIGIAVNFRHKTDTTPKQDLPKIASVSIASTTAMTDRDSDVDGLPDWEERLYYSDPLKFDTDGDGTPDGEEVAEGRNPAIPNTAKQNSPPNDALVIAQDPHFATSTTDILGIKKEFFAKFLSKEASGIRKNTYLNLLKKFDVKKVTPTNQLIDLNISSDNSPIALHDYGNTFGAIMTKYTKRTHRTEEEIVADAVRSSSTLKLKELQLPAVDYKNFSKELKAMKTPTMMASYQLKIVNGYEQMSLGLLAMQSLIADPIVGAGGYEAYTKGRADVTDGYARLVVVFAREKIVFSREEPGSPFYYRPGTASSTITINKL